MMRLRRLTLSAIDIPFVEQFAHATKTRNSSDALLLKIEGDNGVVGWGETLVRPYLSGETIASTFDAFQVLASYLKEADWRLDERFSALTTTLDDVMCKLPKSGTVRAFTGLRCAIELAIIDALLKCEGKELTDVIPPVRKEVVYSGIISAEQPEKALKIVKQLKLLGIQHYKLKVTPKTGVELVREARGIIGKGTSLRLDANASFGPKEAKEFCRAVESFDIAAVEEPLHDATPDRLADLQRTTTIPIMVDESLVTLGDAERLIACGATRMLNIRLAKCGGIAPCLALIKTARAAGIGAQLGALVGETAILSTVGRALAAHKDGFQFVEGSYGTLLLKEDVGRRSVRFGHGGRAPLMRGLGLGVEVNEAIVQKYTVGSHEK